MTASTVKSVNITNLERNPPTIIDGRHGSIKGIFDTIEVAITSLDEADDTILICDIPSNAIILDVQLLNDAVDTDGAITIDVGLYYSGIGDGQQTTDKISGTVILDNCIATSSTVLQAANTAWASVRFEADDIGELGDEAWEIAGLSSDPGGRLFIGLRVVDVATTPAAGTINVLVTYLN